MQTRFPSTNPAAATIVGTMLVSIAQPVSASLVKITGAATDANSATISSGVVTGLKLNGVSYAPSQFAHVRVDQFNGTGSSATVFYNTGSTSTSTDFNPSESFRRGLIETDDRIDTGLINLGTGTSAFV